MNVKIQGGSETYANTGSCLNIAYYLEHEDYHRLEKGLEVESFFSQSKDDIKMRAFVMEMDNNKAKLCKKDAKFYVITISPSEKEIEQMGRSEQERSNAFKQFIREEVMSYYADGFGKDLKADDLLYFAKIHHGRKNKDVGQMHAHIVVSRKTKDNRIKISPKTNHKKAKTAGTVKSGFDRTHFYQSVEDSFDKKFTYQRTLEEKFEYLNIIKNGNIEDLEKVVKASLEPQTKTFNPIIQNVNTNISIPKDVDKDSSINISDMHIPTPFPNVDNEEDLATAKKKKRKSKGRDFGISM